MNIGKEVMDELLDLYDWNIRLTNPDTASGYAYGYADAIGQCILNVGKVLGETDGEPYKYEAYRRVMEYDTTKNYWRKHPTPLSSSFPAETIRENGGQL